MEELFTRGGGYLKHKHVYNVIKYNLNINLFSICGGGGRGLVFRGDIPGLPLPLLCTHEASEHTCTIVAREPIEAYLEDTPPPNTLSRL